MRIGVWICDGCGIEDRGGMPGFPPETWIRLTARSKDRTESPTHDFCSNCAVMIDATKVAETGNLVIQPKPTKRKVKGNGGEDLDDDEGENE